MISKQTITAEAFINLTGLLLTVASVWLPNPIWRLIGVQVGIILLNMSVTIDRHRL